MRKYIVAFALFACVYVSGCGGATVNQEFVKAVDSYTQAILPEYKEYIKNDPNLSEDTKRIRLQSADKFQELVDKAKENQ